LKAAFSSSSPLRRPDAHAKTQNRRIIGHGALHLAAGRAFRRGKEGIQRDAVGLRRVDPACDQVLIRLILRLVGLDLGGTGAKYFST
jgi:hypothetical protein